MMHVKICKIERWAGFSPHIGQHVEWTKRLLEYRPRDARSSRNEIVKLWGWSWDKTGIKQARQESILVVLWPYTGGK